MLKFTQVCGDYFRPKKYCPSVKKYRDSPDSAVFVQPGNCTFEKTVLFRDCFSTKIRINDFWNFKVPFSCS